MILIEIRQSEEEREEEKRLKRLKREREEKSFNRVGVSGDGADAVSQEAVLLFWKSHVAAWKQDEEDI